MESISMRSPYQVAPPQGNLLGSILDFIGQNRQLQLEAGTRGMLNDKMGYGGFVDPFAVQKFEGEGQRQTILGNTDVRAQAQHDWQGADRTSQANTLAGWAQNPAMANDPQLGPVLRNGGGNAMLGEIVARMIGGDRSAKQQQDYANTNAGVKFAHDASQDAQQHQYALKEIEAQIAGRGSATPRLSAQAEVLKQIQDAVAHKAATDGPDWPGGDRRKLQELELAGALQTGRDPQTILKEMAGDAEWNRPGGGRDRLKTEAAEAAAVKQQIGKNKTDPGKYSQEPVSSTGRFPTTIQANPKTIEELRGPSFNPARDLSDYIDQLLGLKGRTPVNNDPW